MAVWIKQDSVQGDAILATNYADDTLVAGLAHEVHRRIAVAIGTTYWVFDTSAVTADVIFSLPINGHCSNDQVYLDSYVIESYTGGVIVHSTNPNGLSTKTAEAVLKTGITPTGTPGDDLRQYIFGSQGQGNVSGGGSNSGAHPKMFPPGALVCIKIVATKELDFEFNFLWYEI